MKMQRRKREKSEYAGCRVGHAKDLSVLPVLYPSHGAPLSWVYLSAMLRGDRP